MAHSPRTVTVLGHDQGREPCGVRSSTPGTHLVGVWLHCLRFREHQLLVPIVSSSTNITTVLFVSLRRRRSEPSRETSCFLLHDNPLWASDRRAASLQCFHHKWLAWQYFRQATTKTAPYVESSSSPKKDCQLQIINDCAEKRLVAALPTNTFPTVLVLGLCCILTGYGLIATGHKTHQSRSFNSSLWKFVSGSVCSHFPFSVFIVFFLCFHPLALLAMSSHCKPSQYFLHTHIHCPTPLAQIGRRSSV
jgi:hypothetical protein